MDYDPNVNDLLFMHAALVKQHGGASGVREAGALEAAVARPWGPSFGEEHFLKAAALCESVIERHPFVDGNKGTETVAGAYLLSTLGLRLAVERGRVEEFAISVAAGDLTLEEVTRWFEDGPR